LTQGISLAGSLARPKQRCASPAQHGGARFRCSRQFLEPLAHRAWKPPSSSSIAEEERLVSLVLSTAARDFRRSRQFMEPLAHRAWKPPTSSSIAEEEHLVSLVLSTAAHDFRRSQL
jgi:hypothetical protein